MNGVVSTVYDLFNRKFFSLPKVLWLPTVMARQPKLIAQIFPIIFLTDWMNGRAVSYMTNRIEALQKETQELSAVRSKIEAFDIKNAELLQRAGKCLVVLWYNSDTYSVLHDKLMERFLLAVVYLCQITVDLLA